MLRRAPFTISCLRRKCELTGILIHLLIVLCSAYHARLDLDAARKDLPPPPKVPTVKVVYADHKRPIGSGKKTTASAVTMSEMEQAVFKTDILRSNWAPFWSKSGTCNDTVH